MRLAALCALFTGLACLIDAQTIDPYYAGSYASVTLGSVPGVPFPYGGLCLKYDDPNTLLISGAACRDNAAAYAVGVTRDSNNHIVGFSGSAQLYAAQPLIDGGLNFGPNNVLFGGQYFGGVMETKVGSTHPDKILYLGIPNPSGCTFVPEGFWNAGHLKVSTYAGGPFYDIELTPDGQGTYNALSCTQSGTLAGGDEGFFYVRGGPLFPRPSMLVCEIWDSGVWAWEVDASADPIPGSRRRFMTLADPEGAFRDPVTGDFLFATYRQGPPDEIYRVSTVPVPEPTTLAVLAIGVEVLRRLRRAHRARNLPHRPEA